MVITRIISRAARDRIRKLLFTDQILLPQRDRIHVQETRDAVHGPFKRKVGGRLAKTAHRFLRRFIRHHRNRLVSDYRDPIGPADRADWFTELEWRAARIGSYIIDCFDLKTVDGAVTVKGD